LLKPHNAPVDLPVFTQLETANARIDAVYFVKDGFASVLADGPGKRNIEVGPHRSGKAKWPTAATFLPTTQGWLRRGRKVRGPIQPASRENEIAAFTNADQCR